MEISDKFSNKLSLPEERLKHIHDKHPEIKISDVKSSLVEPDYIVKSDIDENVNLYHKKKGKYYIVVVVNTDERLVITSFLSDKLKKGELKRTKS